MVVDVSDLVQIATILGLDVVSTEAVLKETQIMRYQSQDKESMQKKRGAYL